MCCFDTWVRGVYLFVHCSRRALKCRRTRTTSTAATSAVALPKSFSKSAVFASVLRLPRRSVNRFLQVNAQSSVSAVLRCPGRAEGVGAFDLSTIESHVRTMSKCCRSLAPKQQSLFPSIFRTFTLRPCSTCQFVSLRRGNQTHAASCMRITCFYSRSLCLH